MRFSAISVSSFGARGPYIAKVRIGAASGSIFWICGRLGVARELADDRGDLVADVLGRRFDVALEEERDADARVALVGRRAQLVDAADRVDRFLDALGDLRFDFLGAGARQVDVDRDDRRVGLRHQVEAELAVRERAEHEQRRGHHDGEDRTLDADVGKHHWPPPCVCALAVSTAAATPASTARHLRRRDFRPRPVVTDMPVAS